MCYINKVILYCIVNPHVWSKWWRHLVPFTKINSKLSEILFGDTLHKVRHHGFEVLTVIEWVHDGWGWSFAAPLHHHIIAAAPSFAKPTNSVCNISSFISGLSNCRMWDSTSSATLIQFTDCRKTQWCVDLCTWHSNSISVNTWLAQDLKVMVYVLLHIIQISCKTQISGSERVNSYNLSSQDHTQGQAL